MRRPRRLKACVLRTEDSGVRCRRAHALSARGQYRCSAYTFVKADAGSSLLMIRRPIDTNASAVAGMMTA